MFLHIKVINQQTSINYEKLSDLTAEKLGRVIQSHPVLKLQIDEDGFSKSIQRGLETINYKDKKLNM